MKKFDLGFYMAVDDTNPGNIREYLETLKKLNVNIFGTDGFCRWQETSFTDTIAAIILEFNMTLHSFHAPFGLRFVEANRLKESIADNKRIVDVASSWGAKNIVWHMRWFRGIKGDTHFAESNVMDSMTEKEMDALFAEIIPETCYYAAEHGININMENLPLFKWGRNCDEILTFIRSIDIANLGFIYDIGHAWCSGIDPAKVILKAGHLLNDTHFHDNLGLGSYNLNKTATCSDVPAIDLHLPPGLGTINWIEVVRALRQIKYPNPIIFEGPSLKGVPNQNTVMAFKSNVELTINNWKAFEKLAEYCPIPQSFHSTNNGTI